MSDILSYSTDVLVIGGGPAGLLTALEARRKGCSVLLMDKGILGHDCSAVGAKQLAAVGKWSPPEDSTESHSLDTIASGCDINHTALVKALTEKAGEAVEKLIKMGMPFDLKENENSLAVEGPAAGHSHPRSLFFSDVTGKMLVDVLLSQCRKYGVRLFSEHVAMDLVREEEIVGALTLSLVSGEPCFTKAKAVVIATGGLGRLYSLSSNPVQISGDGAAIALRAGAELMDLEFVQFYPVTVLAPQMIRGMNLNCHYYGAKLINSDGERFMDRYYPGKGEAVTRDKLAKAISLEIAERRGGPNGGVFIDATMITAKEYESKIPTEWNLLVRAGVDTTKSTCLEVAPSAHYAMGGIRIDSKCRTSIPRLFATGECSAGVQGANRLANNGLTEAIVFGLIAGESAGNFASREKNFGFVSEQKVERTFQKIYQTFSGKEGIQPFQILSDLQETMMNSAGIIRKREKLEHAKDVLNNLRKMKISVTSLSGRWNHSLLSALNVRNMTFLGYALICAALTREESRGAHYREDFPERDDENWEKNIILTANDFEEIALRKEAPDAGRDWEW